MADRLAFADRFHRFHAPPWVLFHALTVGRAKWMRLEPGEIEAEVLESSVAGRVVWSSLWPVSPSDTLEFALVP